MLKKLFIHEWRAFWKVPALVCAFLLLYSTLGSLTFHTPLWDTDNRIVQSILAIGVFTYFVALLAPIVVLILYTALRFYRNMYTDEGYLMHTLPVRKYELILSKLLVSCIWTFFTTVATFLGILIMAFLLATSLRFGSRLFWHDIRNALHEFSTMALSFMDELFGIPFWLVCLMFLGYFLLSTVYRVMMIYGSVSVGHLWKRHPVLGSILSYLAFYLVIQFIASILNVNNLADLIIRGSFAAGGRTAAYLNTIADVRHYIYSVMGIGAALSLIGIVLCYAVTNEVMNRHLNLD